MPVLSTQVGIVGAGPAGLLLSHLLHRAGIESVVLEKRSRDYVQRRVRAGVLEHPTAELLHEVGVGERLRREGIVHHGLELRFDGRGHRISLSELTGGRAIVIYGQGKVVEDLTDARLAAGGTVLFEIDDVAIEGVHDVPGGPAGGGPVIRYTHDGEPVELRCDFIAGCDGFHGICRNAIPLAPAGAGTRRPGLRVYEHVYPYAWLGILARVPPSAEELIYCHHERGFALHSLRSPELSRLYIQVGPGERIEDWPDERIWAEMHTRFATADGWTLREGPVIDRGITEMRGFVAEPMRHGRLFLAGDAAHIVPPTGAKGLNLAVADVYVLARALAGWYRTGRGDLLDGYSDTCLERVWRVQDFSAWMTRMLHPDPGEDGFDRRRRLARLRYVAGSTAAAASLAENYVGLPLPE
jgi:p-hydroxybenzoate 3-monooxygenase